MTLFRSTLFKFFIYFSIVSISEVDATLLVVIIILLLLEQIKSVQIYDLISFNDQFMFVTCTLDCPMTLSTLFMLIGVIICFLDRSFIIILNLDLSF